MSNKTSEKKKEYSKSEIESILRENDWLKKEIKYLRKLTNSKRFKFAEKIATGFNGIFPINTKRRDIIDSVTGVSEKIRARQIERKIKNKSRQILDISKQYEKVIVLNSIPWDTKLKQRPHHLADQLTKLGFFVIYLEDNPLNQFRIIKDNLVTINNKDLLQAFAESNQKLYFLTPNNMPTSYKELNEVREYGFEIIYDFLDEFHEDISGDLSIQLKVWDNLNKLSPALCLATAKKLYNQLDEHLAGKKHKIIMASNAVNVEHFDYSHNNTQNCPLDLRKIYNSKKPIIGFYGALAPWIDFDLINETAKEHPEWEFVLLGIDYNGAASELANYKNIHNLGSKNYEDLPKYTKFFDCAIIPFKHGEIATATSPVKLFEYMAAGLPTVCTRDLNECKGYEYVYMAKNNNEFAECLKQAIKDVKSKKIRDKLLEQAKEQTWEKRAKAISEAL